MTAPTPRIARAWLSAGVREWQRVAKRPEATLRGARLVEALALDRSNLTDLEREFIAASTRATRRRKWLLRGAIVGVVLLAIAVYVVQRTLAAHRLADEGDAEVATAYKSDRARAGHEQRTLAAESFGSSTPATGMPARRSGRRPWSHAATLSACIDPPRARRRRWRRIRRARVLLGDILLLRAQLADAPAFSRDENPVASPLTIRR
jgi:hypothetical protein